MAPADPAAALKALLEERLTPFTEGPFVIHGVTPLIGGACQHNVRLDVTFSAGPLAGYRRLVLRSDAETSLPGSLGRAAEHAVLAAAGAAGVPTPGLHWLLPDVPRPGAAAYLMDFADGVALGAKVVRDPALEAARAALPGQLAPALAAVHGITPASHPHLPISRDPFLPDRPPAEAILAFLRTTLDCLPEPRPASELALRWLRANAPAVAEITLVHGDFRTGNFLVGSEGLVAILDWEFAHWGDPVEDLGWLCVRDWRFGRLDRPAGGFASRTEVVAAYTAASGRAVDPAALHFWEVAGNLRWAAGALFQGLRAESESVPDLELSAIPRRAEEMEHEALRLIEVGPRRLS